MSDQERAKPEQPELSVNFCWEKISPGSIFGGTAWSTRQLLSWFQHFKSSHMAQLPCHPSPLQRSTINQAQRRTEPTYMGCIQTAYCLSVRSITKQSHFPQTKADMDCRAGKENKQQPYLSENTARCHEQHRTSTRQILGRSN